MIPSESKHLTPSHSVGSLSRLLGDRIEQMTRFTQLTPSEMEDGCRYTGVRGRDVFARSGGRIYLATDTTRVVSWWMEELGSLAVVFFDEASVRDELLRENTIPVEIDDDRYAAPDLRSVLGTRIVAIESYQPILYSERPAPNPNWVTRLEELTPLWDHKPYNHILTFVLESGTRLSLRRGRSGCDIELDARFDPGHYAKVLDLRL